MAEREKKESWNPELYETVADRIKRFYVDHEDGRLITEDITTEQDRQVNTWRIKAYVYLDREDQMDGVPKATGLAFEVDGVGMTQKTSALETGETSAIGRALANAGYSGDKRPSKEEMDKSSRQGPTREAQARQRPTPPPEPVVTQAQITEALTLALDQATVTSLQIGRKHYARLARMRLPQEELDQLAQKYAGLPDIPEDQDVEIPVLSIIAADDKAKK